MAAASRSVGLPLSSGYEDREHPTTAQRSSRQTDNGQKGTQHSQHAKQRDSCIRASNGGSSARSAALIRLAQTAQITVVEGARTAVHRGAIDGKDALRSYLLFTAHPRQRGGDQNDALAGADELVPFPWEHCDDTQRAA